VLTTNAQNSIEWDVHQLQLTDFQSKATQIGTEDSITSIHTASVLDFGFIMNNVAFMFTKFNSSKLSEMLVFNRSDTITANKLAFCYMNLTYLNSMPANCSKKSTSRKELF
jgi:hypothetical protein